MNERLHLDREEAAEAFYVRKRKAVPEPPPGPGTDEVYIHTRVKEVVEWLWAKYFNKPVK